MFDDYDSVTAVWSCILGFAKIKWHYDRQIPIIIFCESFLCANNILHLDLINGYTDINIFLLENIVVFIK